MLPVADLEEVSALFGRYDVVDLSASLAALQLLPANASALGRLELAATVANCLPPRGATSAMSVGRLRTALNSAPITTTLSDDGRFDELLVESLSFHGGSYLVSSGLGREAVYVVERLLHSIFFAGPEFPDRAFREEALTFCTAGLRVSDLVLTGARLPRHALPEGDVGDPIVSGRPGRLEELRKAVRFSEAELASLLRPLKLANLAPFVQQMGSARMPTNVALGNPLHVRPILRTGDEYIVALPLALLEAIRHGILSAAVRHGCEQEVAQRFRAAVADDAAQSLAGMGIREERRSLPPPPALPISEAVFKVDDDKLLYVQVVTEDLKDYDPDVAYGRWEKGAIDTQLHARRRRVERALLNGPQPPESVMYLVVPQIMGRDWTLEFDRADTRSAVGPHLGLSAADLAVVADVVEHDPVALYKYAENRDVVVPRGHPLVMLDQLGTYALYRDHGYSLRMDYSGADAGKAMRYIGAGLRLRAQAKRQADEHGARYEGNHGLIVRRWASDGSDPIYVPVHTPDPSIPFLVEGLPVPVWVFGPRPSSAAQAEGNHHVMYMVAFWLWQMTDELAPLVAAASSQGAPLHVRLDLGDRDRWLSGVLTDSKDLGSFSITGDGTMLVRLGAGNFDELRQEGNDGERTVMRLVIDALREAAIRAGSGAVLTGSDRDALLDQQFANPRRKHLLLLGGDNVQATAGPLPGYRPVQHADRSEVKYELGEYLRAKLGLAGDSIPADRRAEVLGTARDWCLAEVERRVAELSPAGLLERLMALNESVVRERFMLKLKVPTRLACYESEEATRQRLTLEIPEANLAGITYRFLVEYAAAVPSAGTRPVSTTVTDRLTAIVAEMQEVAMALDALTKGLSDAALFFNEHGELALETPGAYLEGQSAFLDVHVGETIAGADEGFGRHWAVRTPAVAAGLLEATEAEIDAAMVFETGGPSLVDLRRFVEELAKTGLAQPDEPKRMLRVDLERKLTADLGWPPEKVTAAIDFMLLEPRGSFYSSDRPRGWANADVQPWRFNRRLSYLRRPLVLRNTDAGPEVLWGVRHLWDSWPLQLTYLRLSKFKATSPQLTKLLGRVGDQRGKEFEVKVAELYESHGRFEVLRGRDKFGGKNMTRKGSPDETLGDIDVLVADQAHKTLFAVEAKDIAMALTPSELADELAEYFETPDDAKRAAAMDRHIERTQWLHAHLESVLSEFPFNDEDAAEWTVQGMFVTDDAVASPHIIRPALPVLSYRELEAELNNPRAPERPPQKKRRARRN